MLSGGGGSVQWEGELHGLARDTSQRAGNERCFKPIFSALLATLVFGAHVSVWRVGLSMRLCFGAQHSLATGNGAQLLISKEKNLKLRPGRVILGFWWFGVFFFFSPLGNINSIPDSFTLNLSWQPTAAECFQYPVPEAGEEMNPSGCCPRGRTAHERGAAWGAGMRVASVPMQLGRCLRKVINFDPNGLRFAQ